MKIVKIFVERKLNNDDKKLKLYSLEQKTITIKFLYVEKFLLRIKKELNKVVHQFKPQFKLNYISYSSFKIGQLFRKSLGRIPFHHKSHVSHHISWTIVYWPN